MKFKITFILLIILLFSCSSKFENFQNDINSKDRSIRIDAVENLRNDKEKITKYLNVALSSKDDDVVWRAIEISGIKNEKSLIIKFISFLDNKTPIIRYTSRDTLINLGSEAESSLLNSYEDADIMTKKMILQCLSKIGTYKTLKYRFPCNSDNIKRRIDVSLLEIAKRSIIKINNEFIDELIKSEIKIFRKR